MKTSKNVEQYIIDTTDADTQMKPSQNIDTLSKQEILIDKI